jgi:hypothetical protein
VEYVQWYLKEALKMAEKGDLDGVLQALDA